MDFEEIRKEAKKIPCMQYLHKARNGGIVCPFCGSGTGEKGTGAVVYYENDNSFYCNKCGRRGDTIDAYLGDAGRDPEDGRAHREGVIELGESIGLYLDEENSKGRTEWTKEDREGLQRMKDSRGNTANDPDEWPEIEFNWDDNEEPTEEKPAEDGLNGRTAPEGNTGGKMPEGDAEAVKNESEAPENNIPGLFREDCEKWAADIGKTDYLTKQGISPEVIKRYHVGYIPATNEVVFPYSPNYSYYEKRKAQKDYELPYRKPNKDIAGPEPLYNSAALYSGKPCFICEGIIDVLSIATAGGSGTATTGAGNYKKIIAKCKEKKPEAPLILWLDNDLVNKEGHRPGQEEQAKLADALTKEGIPFIEAVYNLDLYGLNHGDPNDFLRANPEQFKADVQTNLTRAEALQELGPEMGPFIDSIYSERYKPIPTGIKGLDKFLHGGLIRQTLVLLSSKPGAGKTILSAMALESMAKQGIPSIYLNLEMSKEQLLARSISRILFTEYNYKMDSVKVLQGYNHTPKEKELILSAARKYVEQIGPNMTYNPLETSDLDTILDYLEETAEKAEAAGRPAPCVCVDYLHILTSTIEKDTGEIIKRAVQRLKEYASKHNAIVIAIEAQNRAANKSKNADIAAGRDTSALEYSGDLCMQLKAGDDEDPEHGDPNRINLYVTKSRFTEFDSKKGLPFIKHGGLSYFEQIGEWTNVPVNERTPFDDDGQKGKRKTGKADSANGKQERLKF